MNVVRCVSGSKLAINLAFSAAAVTLDIATDFFSKFLAESFELNNF